MGGSPLIRRIKIDDQGSAMARKEPRRRPVAGYGPFDDLSGGAAVHTMRDLEADAGGVLDVLGARTAHLVGMSLGGTIALWLAIDHRERVASLALLSAG